MESFEAVENIILEIENKLNYIRYLNNLYEIDSQYAGFQNSLNICMQTFHNFKNRAISDMYSNNISQAGELENEGFILMQQVLETDMYSDFCKFIENMKSCQVELEVLNENELFDGTENDGYSFLTELEDDQRESSVERSYKNSMIHQDIHEEEQKCSQQDEAVSIIQKEVKNLASNVDRIQKFISLTFKNQIFESKRIELNLHRQDELNMLQSLCSVKLPEMKKISINYIDEDETSFNEFMSIAFPIRNKRLVLN